MLFAHFFQTLDATFVTCTAGLNTLTNPLFFFSKALIKQSVLRGLILKTLFTELKKAPVIAYPVVEISTIQIDDPRSKCLNECPVVTDEYQCTIKLFELFFKPLDCFDVHMVGWLVENEQLRVGHQRPCQHDTTLPTARQLVKAAFCREVQALNHGINTLLNTPAICGFDLCLKSFEFFQVSVCAACRLFVVTRQNSTEVADTIGDNIVHRLVDTLREFLLQRGNTQRIAILNDPIVRGNLAIDDFQQGRLAFTIAADNTQALTALNIKIDFIEKNVITKCQLNLL